ncbi:hypothetical protein PISL3812_05098 [Talaromyces islandicus]|uniref:Uncharacterized protein n=1 Tax=Talaromyces islandicus TaxID=28573 RepID=A0A0U1LZD7_TALIS|nr:hypothetical protein PISL3812_05098 [Talaromyces islandicus]
MEQRTIAKYLEKAALKVFIRDNVVEANNPLQAPIDNMILNICHCYFDPHKFIIESQPYPGDPTSVKGLKKGDKLKSNVTVSVLHVKVQKAFVIEAKRYPKPQDKLAGNWADNNNNWEPHLEQLDDYMTKARNHDRYSGTMYGMLVVGDRVRFYEKKNEPTATLAPCSIRTMRRQNVFSIADANDSLAIEDVLITIREKLLSHAK